MSDTLNELLKKLDGIRASAAGIRFKQIQKSAGDTGVAVLRGYLGDDVGSAVPALRLYATLESNDYVDVRLADVVDIVDLTTDREPLAGQAIWVKLGANLTRGSTRDSAATQRLVLSDLTSGGIADLRTPGGARPGGYASPSPWCGGGYASPSPWCGGGYASPRPWVC